MTTAQEQANGHNPEQEAEWFTDFTDSKRINYTPNFQFPNRGDGDNNGDAQGFSKFLFHMSEEIHSIRGIIMQASITDERVKLLLLGLLDIYRTYINADAATRRGRQKDEEELAKRAQTRMSNEVSPQTGDGENLVEHLLGEWYTGAAREQIALVLEANHGFVRAEQSLDAYGADHQPPMTGRQWLRDARSRMEKAIVGASNLPPAHAEYFWARQRETAIGMERNFDHALERPTRDFTEVRTKASEGTPLFKIAEDMPWVLQEIYNRVVVSVADGQRIKDLMTMYMRVWPWEQQAPPEMRKLALEERNDIDSGTGNRKSDDRKNEKRQKEQK